MLKMEELCHSFPAVFCLSANLYLPFKAIFFWIVSLLFLIWIPDTYKFIIMFIFSLYKRIRSNIHKVTGWRKDVAFEVNQEVGSIDTSASKKTLF